ncbi:Lrp/AsnC family transcriptional regulator [Candidatus Woesearchaeota archaeon]|nr:MAG: Lrp/AsnC family transcriptional regulator [Candidatus Woesearchaeota archaeon]
MISMLDSKDKAILAELRRDSKQTTKSIARKLRIPVTTVHHRIKRMEETGVIKGYTVLINHERIGKQIAAYVLVSVNSSLPNGQKTDQHKIARILKSHDEVEEASIVTGGTDILLKLRCANVAALNKFLLTTIRGIEGVDKTQTMVVLEEIEDAH